jgi:hypothetical protein
MLDWRLQTRSLEGNVSCLLGALLPQVFDDDLGEGIGSLPLAFFSQRDIPLVA